MTNEETLLSNIVYINEQLKETKHSTAHLRKELADAIQQATTAGITYRQIGEHIGKSKTGIASIVERNKSE